MVHAIKYPHEPIIDEHECNSYPWINDIYLETNSMYSDSKWLDNWEVFFEVWGPMMSAKLVS